MMIPSDLRIPYIEWYIIARGIEILVFAFVAQFPMISIMHDNGRPASSMMIPSDLRIPYIEWYIIARGIESLP